MWFHVRAAANLPGTIWWLAASAAIIAREIVRRKNQACICCGVHADFLFMSIARSCAILAGPTKPGASTCSTNPMAAPTSAFANSEFSKVQGGRYEVFVVCAGKSNDHNFGSGSYFPFVWRIQAAATCQGAGSKQEGF